MSVVIKCGGRGDVDLASVASDVATLVSHGEHVVIVHGGSAAIDDLARRLGIPARKLQAPDGTVTRYTDVAALEAVCLGLLGAVKPRLVAELARQGLRAISMSGLDAQLVSARRKAAVRAVIGTQKVVIRDNLAGKVDSVDPDVLHRLMGADLIPVLSPPALSTDGVIVNVDADRLAAAVATAIGADQLVLLTSAPGVLRDPCDAKTLLPHLDPCDPFANVDARGGMRLKLVAASHALTGGVPSVVIGDGRADQPVLRALAGAGTRLNCAHQTAGRRSA